MDETQPLCQCLLCEASRSLGVQVRVGPVEDVALRVRLAQERERCATVAEAWWRENYGAAGDVACWGIAAAIRALGDEP